MRALLVQCPQSFLHRAPLTEQRKQLPPLILNLPFFHRIVIFSRFVFSYC